MPPTQTNPQGRNSCVPACLRMVLAYEDIALNEGELCNLLNMQAAGTEVWNVLLLGEHLENCRINIDSISLDRMQESLIDNIAPIAVVVTQHLSYWQHNTIHAVVFVGITDEAIHVNDLHFLMLHVLSCAQSFWQRGVNWTS